MAKKSHEQYVKDLEAVNPNIEPLEEYKGVDTNSLHRCKICGHKWYPTPHNLLSGYGCPECRERKRSKTHEQYIEDLKKVNPNIEPLEEYKGVNTKSLHRCKICGHKWYPRPNSLLSGHGCPECRNRKRRKTHEQYIEDLKKVNPNIEIKSRYNGDKEDILAKCKICGHEWWVRPSSLLDGTGCEKCFRNRQSKNNKKYDEELIEKNIPIKRIGEYIKTNIPIWHECTICGYRWYTRPCHVLSGSTHCEECKRKKKEKQYDDNLKKRLIHSKRIEMYLNSYTPIMHQCTICGYKFTAPPNQVLCENTCRNCHNFGISAPQKYLYYSFSQVLNNVLDRDKELIGMELDIVIPDYKIAIEYGAWYYHKDKTDRDIEKYKKLKEKGYTLLIIYDNVYEDIPKDVLPYVFKTYRSSIYTQKTSKQVKALVLEILQNQIGVNEIPDFERVERIINGYDSN